MVTKSKALGQGVWVPLAAVLGGQAAMGGGGGSWV